MDVDSYTRDSATFVTFRRKRKRERRPMAQLRTHLPLKRASTCSAPVHRSPLHPKRLLAAGTTSSHSRQRPQLLPLTTLLQAVWLCRRRHQSICLVVLLLEPTHGELKVCAFPIPFLRLLLYYTYESCVEAAILFSDPMCTTYAIVFIRKLHSNTNLISES